MSSYFFLDNGQTTLQEQCNNMARMSARPGMINMT